MKWYYFKIEPFGYCWWTFSPLNKQSKVQSQISEMIPSKQLLQKIGFWRIHREAYSEKDWQKQKKTRELQWGTKVLRHFRKMAPFWIVDLPIPFPCLPPSLPPKINVVFWTLKSFFYFRQHWFGGVIECLDRVPAMYLTWLQISGDPVFQIL